MKDCITTIEKIDPNSSLENLKSFLNNAGQSLQTFRYFEERPIFCVKNHAATFLMFLNKTAVGYSHLDPSDNKLWLGICISEGYTNKKLGAQLMGHTLRYAKLNKLNELIHLSAYKTNYSAIRLYEKHGFVKFDENENSFFMRKPFYT